MQESIRYQPTIVGVDVAKAELVISVHGTHASAQSLSNDSSSIQAWLHGLPRGSVVAMEASGRYHRLLATLAHAAGMLVYVLNARDVYYYAKALGARGKTDRLDAAVIARYAAEHRTQLRPWQPVGDVPQALEELLRRRLRLTRQLVAVRQTLRDAPALQQTSKDLQEQFERALQDIDAQLQALIDGQPELSQGVQRLRSITGFGPQASILLAALFSRMPFANAEAVVAFSGLDPRPSDSGIRRGKRRLSKRGPAWLRHVMYLAAFAASHSRDLGPLYQALRARGFASTQALVIVARKLLRVAWAVWRDGKPFEASRVGAQAGCNASAPTAAR